MQMGNPTIFELFAFILLPLLVGVGTLTLSGLALSIARDARADAKEAMRRNARAERMEQAAGLHELVNQTTVAIWKNEAVQAAWEAVRDSTMRFSSGESKIPTKVVAQLMYWIMYVKQHAPDEDTRYDIAIDITSHLEDVLFEYARDDTGHAEFSRHTIDDI